MNFWYIWMPIIMFFILVYFTSKRRKLFIVSKHIVKGKILGKSLKERMRMKELAQRFIGKDCYINLIEGTADGIVKEVTDSGIVLEKGNNIQVVNLDYVIKIFEYPRNKKGKRAIIWG